jgi:hypothetical protein
MSEERGTSGFVVPSLGSPCLWLSGERPSELSSFRVRVAADLGFGLIRVSELACPACLWLSGERPSELLSFRVRVAADLAFGLIGVSELAFPACVCISVFVM